MRRGTQPSRSGAKHNAKKSKKVSEEKEKQRRATAKKKEQFAHEKNENNQLDQIFKTGDHVCRLAVSNALKKWFADNAPKIPSGMLNSFLDACEHFNENTTNMKNPSNHALWKKAVASTELDFDWAK